jgi:hypothetical protein
MSARSLPILLLLLAVLIPAAPATAQSSPIHVQPHQLYRFRISNTDLGYILTSNNSEGVNLGFTYDGIVGSIYPVPSPGYTPDPSAGLYPLHRWTVVENGWRVYTYHSIYYFQHGSNYTYDGIRGYVFPPAATSHTFASGSTATLSHLSIYYSQNYGFWNGIVLSGAFEFPPSGAGFSYQGLIAASPPPTVGTRPGACSGCPLPGTGPNYSVRFDPPPPPPQCDPVEELACYDNGGFWDSNTCLCAPGNPGGCDPIAEQNCYNYGGYWNSVSCMCEL